MHSNGSVMRVVHSVPEKGWGFAEICGGEKIFFRSARGMELRLVGTTLQSVCVPVTIPKVDDEIIVTSTMPGIATGRYPQAGRWMSNNHAKEMEAKMEAARQKAAATLAELAEKTKADNLARQEQIRENAERHGHGSGKGKKDQKSQKGGGKRTRQSA